MLLHNKTYAVTAVTLCILLLSLLTVFNQVKALGLSWQEEHYMQRMEDVLAGKAGAPWQYRILSESIGLTIVRTFQLLGVPRPEGTAFVLIRVAQNCLIFFLALVFYRRLGIPYYPGLLGVLALAWGMTHANYNSDLSFNTYTDIILFLLAGLAIVTGRYRWILIITALGAFNRETIIFVPLALMMTALFRRHPESVLFTTMRITMVCIGIYMVVFFGLRAFWGPREWVQYSPEIHRGWEQFWFNMTYDRTWGHLAGVLGIMPLIALMAWRFWPPLLKAFLVAIVPGWFLLHFFFGTVAEARLVLVPQVMVFIPGALFALTPVPSTEPGVMQIIDTPTPWEMGP